MIATKNGFMAIWISFSSSFQIASPRGWNGCGAPRARWVRVPAGVVLMCGGFLGFLPILGFWMLPLGLLLLAIDIPLLRRPTTWLVDRIGRLLTRFAAPRISGQ